MYCVYADVLCTYCYAVTFGWNLFRPLTFSDSLHCPNNRQWREEREKLIQCIHLQQLELSQRSLAAHERATDIAKVSEFKKNAVLREGFFLQSARSHGRLAVFLISVISFVSLFAGVRPGHRVLRGAAGVRGGHRTEGDHEHQDHRRVPAARRVG